MNMKASRSSSAAGDPPLAARLRATFAGWHLDGELAAGVDPASSPVLAARAARLCSRRTRDELARGLEQIVAGAPRPTRPKDAIWEVHRPTVDAARTALLELARQLRADADITPQAVALTSRLLIDGPLHTGDPEALTSALAKIRAGLGSTCTRSDQQS